MDDTLATKYAMLIFSIANGTASEMDDPRGREACQDIVGKIKIGEDQTAVKKITSTLKECKIVTTPDESKKILEEIRSLIKSV